MPFPDLFQRRCYYSASNQPNSSAKSMVSSRVIHRSPEILGGTPVFRGTRVPVQALIDYLEEGRPLGEFLEDFSTVNRQQATEALEDLKKALPA